MAAAAFVLGSVAGRSQPQQVSSAQVVEDFKVLLWQKIGELKGVKPERPKSTAECLANAKCWRDGAIDDIDDGLDRFLASVLDVWSVKAGEWLEGVALVKLFRDRSLTESAPLVAVASIMGTLYVSFCWAYLPAVGLASTSTSSMVFHSSFVLAALSYERGLTTDPGGIPDNWKKDEDGRPLFETEGARIFMHERKRKTGELRFCSKEMKFKPDRAHFCTAMGRNVLRMDHYCPWLANCVGYHNHKYFLLFLFYTLVASGTLDISVFHALYYGTFSAGHTFMMSQGAVLSTLLTGVLGPFFGFHCWLLCNNVTTIEYCEKKRDEDATRISPYDAGLHKNIQCVMGDRWSVWLLPISGPSGDGLQWGIAEMKAVQPSPAPGGRLAVEDTDGDATEASASASASNIAAVPAARADAWESASASIWALSKHCGTAAKMLPSFVGRAGEGLQELRQDFTNAVEPVFLEGAGWCTKAWQGLSFTAKPTALRTTVQASRQQATIPNRVSF